MGWVEFHGFCELDDLIELGVGLSEKKQKVGRWELCGIKSLRIYWR